LVRFDKFLRNSSYNLIALARAKGAKGSRDDIMRIIEIFSLWGKYKPRVREHAEKLRMKCPNCGHWNRVPVNKVFIERNSPEPKVRVMVLMYKP